MDLTKKKQFTIPNVGAGGLRLDKRPWQLAENEWADCLNVQFVKGAVERVRGWTLMGSALPADPGGGVTQKLVAGYGYLAEDTTVAGYVGYILVTTHRIYHLGFPVTSATEDANFADILLANFPAPMVFPVPNSTVALYPEVGFDTYRGVCYVSPQNNPPRSITAGGNAIALGGAPPNATDIVVYGERGILGRIQSGGPSSQSTIRWSAIGDLNTWNAANTTNIERLPSAMMKLKRTGQHLLGYKSTGIERLLITPDSVTPYRSDIVNDGIGLASVRGLGSYGALDFIVSKNDVYAVNAIGTPNGLQPAAYGSGVPLIPIGQAVRSVVCRQNDVMSVGPMAYGDPAYDEILFSPAGSLVYAYSPMFGTWSIRDMGGRLRFISEGPAGAGTFNQLTGTGPRSFFSSDVVNALSVYRASSSGATYPSGFPTTSFAKTGWRDFGTLLHKRIHAHMPKFARNTGTTMTIEYRKFNNPTDDPNPAAFQTATVVCDGSEALIPLNIDARWVEVKYIQNSNSQPWALIEETWFGDPSTTS